jgi:uncharacterized repeat protein (TIGR04076 family)
MAMVKITVLKKLVNKDIIDEYAVDELKEGYCRGCSQLQTGQEFFVDRWESIPDGFCSWAWADIQRDVASMLMGGSAPWIRRKGTVIPCCTSGFRPTVFRVERVEEPVKDN